MISVVCQLRLTWAVYTELAMQLQARPMPSRKTLW